MNTQDIVLLNCILMYFCLKVTETNWEKFLRLDIHKFFKLCTYFEMGLLDCVPAYLEQYEPPESVDFSEPPWTSLFDAVLERYVYLSLENLP